MHRKGFATDVGRKRIVDANRDAGFMHSTQMAWKLQFARCMNEDPGCKVGLGADISIRHL